MEDNKIMTVRVKRMGYIPLGTIIMHAHLPSFQLMTYKIKATNAGPLHTSVTCP